MSARSRRLAPPFGRLLDRSRPLAFRFNGAAFTGYAGDCIASALMAGGQRVLSRSFKYHRPRGVLTMAGHDANTLVQVGDEPNVRADLEPLAADMRVEAQNVYGSLRFDAARLLDHLGGFLPVGFYYQAFYRPRGAWRIWEPLIRRLAGLGRVSESTRRSHARKGYEFADVAVIGAGLAGMAAALTAADAGAEVLLIERDPLAGGAAGWMRLDAAGEAFEDAAELAAAVAGHPRVRLLVNTTCTGWFADNWLTLVAGREYLRLRAGGVVLATGVLQQPLVFAGNDLPGVMLHSAAARLIHLYGVAPGQRAVVAGVDDDALANALDLHAAGIEVAAVLTAGDGAAHSEALLAAVHAAGIEHRQGWQPRKAIAEAGELAAVLVSAGHRSDRIACDLLTMSAGTVPQAQLLCHRGGELRFDPTLGRLGVHADAAVVGAWLAGAVNGVVAPAAARTDGEQVAALAVGRDPGPRLAADGVAGRTPVPTAHPDGRDFIDFDEDLQVKDIQGAVADGYDHVELTKRYSTAVMGPSQGRHSAFNTLRVATAAAGGDMAELRATTQRPPFYPEPIDTLAGIPMHPLRRTALHDWHLRAGAQMMPAGSWLRPAWYGPVDQAIASVRAEALAVREGVGIIDVSTLGKLEVNGPDAAEFLNRMYTFAYAKQPVGRTRYALMTDETGAIIDDGIVCRLSPSRFYVSATTTGVDNVYRSMLRFNAMWRLDVTLANVTGALAAINVAGPRSREVVAAVVDDADFSGDGFPYLAVREGRFAGAAVLMARVGFVGELGYELHLPADRAEALWEALLQAGEGAGIRPFGVEAQRLLRLEKGHIIVGQDTDGLTLPQHADMAWAIAANKPFFLGQRAIAVQVRNGLDRQLVAFTLPSGHLLPEPGNLVLDGERISGRVTSAAESPACGRIIGLAYAAPRQATPGTELPIRLGNGDIARASVCKAPFYDPEGERQAL